ncbi:BgTH12-03768 [Blumeria graminis f. sp. triticale]|uniref:BgTH12-03768 n=1 Tax=Blumeria graminis f. sp. triticale TaxID=1689686 RepID=A0A9W4CVS4_BLUGR|nr:BgTH12-03768 [Blumeria graminis f. sp. triticale]
MQRYCHEAGLAVTASRPQGKWQCYFARASISKLHEINVVSLLIQNYFLQNEATQWRVRSQRRNLGYSIVTKSRFLKDWSEG